MSEYSRTNKTHWQSTLSEIVLAGCALHEAFLAFAFSEVSGKVPVDILRPTHRMAVLTRAIMTNPKPHGDLLSGKGLPVASTALTLAVMLVVGIVLTPSVQVQTFSVLHRFTGTPDGSEPIAH